jgi:thioredoxin-like negative regulator of GroEL
MGPPPPGSVVDCSSGAALRALLAARGAGGLTVGAFSAGWCAASKRLLPPLRVWAAAHPSVLVLRVDCDAAVDAAAEEGIEDFPTLLVWRGGARVVALVGAAAASIDALDAALGAQ